MGTLQSDWNQHGVIRSLYGRIRQSISLCSRGEIGQDPPRNSGRHSSWIGVDPVRRMGFEDPPQIPDASPPRVADLCASSRPGPGGCALAWVFEQSLSGRRR
jgi:hypothetical protein